MNRREQENLLLTYCRCRSCRADASSNDRSAYQSRQKAPPYGLARWRARAALPIRDGSELAIASHQQSVVSVFRARPCISFGKTPLLARGHRGSQTSRDALWPISRPALRLGSTGLSAEAAAFEARTFLRLQLMSGGVPRRSRQADSSAISTPTQASGYEQLRAVQRHSGRLSLFGG